MTILESMCDKQVKRMGDVIGTLCKDCLNKFVCEDFSGVEMSHGVIHKTITEDGTKFSSLTQVICTNKRTK